MQFQDLLVVGCGNEDVGDDAAGLRIVERLRSECREAHCRFVLATHAGADILEVMDPAPAILFVDAVVSGSAPGTLHLIPLPDERLGARAAGAVSSHGWTLAEALALWRALGRNVPRMMLMGVEIESAVAGRKGSAAVERAIETAVAGFGELVAALLRGEMWDARVQVRPGERLLVAA